MQVARASEIGPIRSFAAAKPAAPLGGTAKNCSSCHLRDRCLPSGLPDPALGILDSLMFNRRRVKEGQTLYREGDCFQSLFAVRSGTFKSTLTLLSGREQVTGFQMAGDLLALDGVAAGRHATSAVALEDAEVCSIPYAQLSAAALTNPGMQQALVRLMSREIVREHGLMTLLGTMSTEERVASFLFNISQRMKARGYSPQEFNLRMSRADIGSYLGMTLETVSRTFSAFQQQGRLAVNKKHLRIIDLDGFTRMMDMRPV